MVAVAVAFATNSLQMEYFLVNILARDYEMFNFMCAQRAYTSSFYTSSAQRTQRTAEVE